MVDLLDKDMIEERRQLVGKLIEELLGFREPDDYGSHEGLDDHGNQIVRDKDGNIIPPFSEEKINEYRNRLLSDCGHVNDESEDDSLLKTENFEESVKEANKSKAEFWEHFQLPTDIVIKISSSGELKKLLNGEYSNEEPSNLTDDEIIQKASTGEYSARSLGPRFKALWTADLNMIGRDVLGAVFELFTILAFWSGRYAKQMVRVFKKSALSAQELYTHFGYDIADKLAQIANMYTRDRPVYRKPKTLSPSGQDQNAVVINTGSGYVMLGDYHPEDHPRYVWNDIGIANLFADIYKDTVKYCTDRRRWYVYDGKRWVANDSAAMECCKELTLALYSYAKCFDRLRDYDDDDKPLTYRKYVKQYHTRRRRESILKDASSVHTVTSNDFDADRYLFNCQNGTYHLREQRFTRHSPADMLTKLSGVTYNAYSECPRWEKHIEEVAEYNGGRDPELAKYIQKCLGYALTGDTRYECGFVFYGPRGRNGKSLTLDTYLKMMGDYGCSTAPDTITQSRFSNSSGPKENIARLAGVRFVNISEPDQGMQLSESTIKTLTGNDKIVARRLNEGSVEYYPQFKLFISTNYRPLVSDKTVFSRLKVIPFQHYFEEKERDTSLKELFARPENLSGIFNWCCEGLEELLKNEKKGFDEPEAVKQSKELYIEDNNILENFINDTFVLDAESAIPRQEVYDAFKIWCNKQNAGKEEKMSKRLFLQAMETMQKIEATRMRVNGGGRDENPRWCFKGLRWKPEADSDTAAADET